MLERKRFSCLCSIAKLQKRKSKLFHVEQLPKMLMLKMLIFHVEHVEQLPKRFLNRLCRATALYNLGIVAILLATQENE